MEGGRKVVELTISLQGERVAAGVEGERREGGREGGGCVDVEREKERRGLNWQSTLQWSQESAVTGVTGVMGAIGARSQESQESQES